MLQIDPEKYELYENIGFMYSQKREFDSTITYYRKYADIFVDDSDILHNLSYIYKYLGEFDKSISTIEDAMLLSNENINLKTSLLHFKYQDRRIKTNEYIQSINDILNNPNKEVPDKYCENLPIKIVIDIIIFMLLFLLTITKSYNRKT